MPYIVLTNVIAVIIVLGVMIVIHELGHFMAAKWFGVRVETFSLGFGKRLFGFRKGDTDYRVSLLPLGGYVKMAGEQPGETLTGDPNEFLSKPKWQRFVIAFMGPAMNMVLAVVLLTGLYMVKYQKAAYQEGPAVLGYVEKDSAAAKAGFRPGDVITKLEGLDYPDWEAVEIKVISSPAQPLAATARRADGSVFRTTITPEVEPRNRIGTAGWAPYLPSIIKGVERGYPAAQAGLKPNDRIVAVDGEPLRFSPLLPQKMQESKDKPLRLTVLRSGQTFDVTIRPIYGKAGGTRIWRIGIELKEDTIEKHLAFLEALNASLETNKKFALLIFDFLGKMMERKMSPRSVAGPIEIARMSGEAARQGMPELINLMAAISLNLGIFNLFPIPVLDGGVILLLAIEGLIRRDLSLQVKERIVQVGFVFLVLIAVFAIYNDILKSLPASIERMLP